MPAAAVIMPRMDPVRVGISSCLLGENVRYDGGHRQAPVLLECLGPHVTWVPVCPELEVGMGVPREPVRLVAGGGPGPSLIGVETRADWSERMRRWAAGRALRLQELGLDGYILKSRSPSCGLAVPLFAAPGADVSLDGRSERGLFAAALLDRLPDLPVEEERQLLDPHACERFLARVLAYHRRHSERTTASCSAS